MTEDEIAVLLGNDEFLKSRAEYNMWSRKYKKAFKRIPVSFFEMLILYGYKYHNSVIKIAKLLDINKRNVYIVARRLWEIGYLKKMHDNNSIFPNLELSSDGRLVLNDAIEIWKGLVNGLD